MPRPGRASPQGLGFYASHGPTQGYDRLLRALGSNLPQLLLNLNNLHLHLSMGMPAMAPPSFDCTNVTATSLELHYYSQRPALSPIVKARARLLCCGSAPVSSGADAVGREPRRSLSARGDALPPGRQGIVHSLSKTHFNVAATVEQIKSRDSGDDHEARSGAEAFFSVLSPLLCT